MPHWKQTRESPPWVKNVCVKLRSTILKSITKLRPKGNVVNWRNYGRCIGIAGRYKTFLAKDVPQTLKEVGLDKIGKKKSAKLKSLFDEEEMRQYYLKVLGRKPGDKTSLVELAANVLAGGLVNLEKMKQTALNHLANQDAKTNKLFLTGMAEGYATFLNEDGQFTGDDRRVDIHLELLACQYEIEKMRKSVLPKTSKHLIGELKKLPEFKNKTNDWFKDVFKDIHLTIGRRGRPPQYSQA